MALKDILVCLEAGEAADGRLKLAAQIAHLNDAHLAAVYVLADDGNQPLYAPSVPGFVGAGPAGAVGAGDGLAAAAEIAEPPVTRGATMAEAGEQRFRDALRLHGLEGEWHPLARGDAAELTALAKTADLVVIGQVSRDAPSAAGIRPEDVLLACGRPLLIVPYAGHFSAVGQRALIAWDGTREASRALHDALPLIAGAEAVTVVTVRAHESDFEYDRAALDRVVRHLDHHGIPAKAEESLRGDLAVSDVLLSRASDLGADLLVAGGYHHSPWREALIGGVSRDLLRHMTVPVLMSH